MVNFTDIVFMTYGLFIPIRYIRATLTIKFTTGTWSTRMVSPGIRCRQIGEADIAAVAALLTRGFANRNRQFWLHALEQLKRRTPPQGLPKYGYLLESDGAVVGAILLICSSMQAGDTATSRCNLSSWYVEPAFRTYATLLVSHALRHKDVTYLNVSPAPHTRPIIEAQGFSRYCDGVFVAVPMLSGPFSGTGVKVLDARIAPAVGFDPFEQEVLLQHAAVGCISVWCMTAEHAYPFVFRPRRIRGVIPYAQMIYCHDLADFVRLAGPLGRYLALRGRPLVVVDANAPIPGLVGVFRRGSMPKYFRGPQRPRLGDLAYTEYALLGV
jgi:hypothetical protein